MKNLVNFLLPLDLQFFADGGNGNEPKTYTEAEYNAMVEEQKKLKARIDELSANEKKHKEEMKNKMSEDEKKQKEQEEREQEFQALKEKVLNADIREQLLENGTFTKEETDKIINAKSDPVELAKTLNKLFAEKLDSAKKTWQQELVDKTKGINGGNGDPNEESVASKKAKNFKKSNEEPIKWGNFN